MGQEEGSVRGVGELRGLPTGGTLSFVVFVSILEGPEFDSVEQGCLTFWCLWATLEKEELSWATH